MSSRVWLRFEGGVLALVLAAGIVFAAVLFCVCLERRAELERAVSRIAERADAARAATARLRDVHDRILSALHRERAASVAIEERLLAVGRRMAQAAPGQGDDSRPATAAELAELVASVNRTVDVIDELSELVDAGPFAQRTTKDYYNWAAYVRNARLARAALDGPSNKAVATALENLRLPSAEEWARATGGGANSIDSFVFKKLEDAALSPSSVPGEGDE